VTLNLTVQADWNIVAGATSNFWVSWTGPIYRGLGQLSKADQALARLAVVEQQISEIQLTLESL
jgi:hypothetical protein